MLFQTLYVLFVVSRSDREILARIGRAMSDGGGSGGISSNNAL